MVTKIISQDKSDKWIRDKMLQHVSGKQTRRNLIRQRLDNGYEDNGVNHAIYYLSGSPIKAYAVRVDTRISFYESSGKRWAEYSLGRHDIIHEVSETNQELLQDNEGGQQ